MDELDHNTRAGEITHESLLATRLWVQADISSYRECWEWQGRQTNGYGSITLDNVDYYTHRVSYRLTHGEIPEPQINHLCDNRLCVNPMHLYPGTQSDNMKDNYERNERVREALDKFGKDAPPEGHQGESHPMSKLDRDDVEKIKERLSDGESPPQIADDYPVGRNSIGNIKRGDTWSHV